MGDDPPRRARPARQVIVDRTAVAGRLPVSAARIRAIAELVLAREGVRQARIQLSLTTGRRIAAVHRRLLGVGGPTDIVTLEYPSSGRGAPVFGEAWIAVDVAREGARRFDVSWREEVARLVVHGVLHMLGWTHPEGTSRERSPMWRRQERHLAAARRAGWA